jgi:putative sigma-54 modulation protein
MNVLQRTRADRHKRQAVERERWPLEPLSLDEAIESLEATTSGIVVFRNTDTERVNVVYRRPDGKLGLIEPEP